jgi:hypothetical protein
MKRFLAAILTVFTALAAWGEERGTPTEAEAMVR